MIAFDYPGEYSYGVRYKADGIHRQEHTADDSGCIFGYDRACGTDYQSGRNGGHRGLRILSFLHGTEQAVPSRKAALRIFRQERCNDDTQDRQAHLVLLPCRTYRFLGPHRRKRRDGRMLCRRSGPYITARRGKMQGACHTAGTRSR